MTHSTETRYLSPLHCRKLCPPLFNRYTAGMNFGLHTDNAIRIGAATLRTDISGPLFLSEPGDYDGGELVIQDTHVAQRIKLAAESLVLYPSGSLHQVEPVIRGRRDVAVFWVQSMLRDASQRALLLQLDASIQGLRARVPGSPEIQHWCPVTTICSGCGRISKTRQ